jgi:hypothetical protein
LANAEGEYGDSEEIHRSNGFALIAEAKQVVEQAGLTDSSKAAEG